MLVILMDVDRLLLFENEVVDKPIADTALLVEMEWMAVDKM